MSVEIIGMVGTREFSETRGALAGPAIDPDYLTRFARAHEAAGFDRVLIGYGATGPDGFAVAAHVLYATTTLKVLIAHRPGFVAPTLVARKLATLDALTGGGRVGIHHITGGDELDQKRDGDFADHDRRYARTAEFMSLLRRELTATEPFDYSGEFYQVKGAYSTRPAGPGSRSTSAVPRRRPSGSAPSTPTSTCSGANRWPRSPSGLPESARRPTGMIARCGSACPSGRSSPPPRTRPGSEPSRSGRPPSTAWPKRSARRENGGNGAKDAGGRLFGFRESTSVGSERLQRQGAQSDVHDERLWYGVTKLTGPGGNSTALVGTPAQVADALLAYRRVGVDTFLIRGFDPLDDVIDWGSELVPLLRDGAARTPVNQAPASQTQADHTPVDAAEPSPLVR